MLRKLTACVLTFEILIGVAWSLQAGTTNFDISHLSYVVEKHSQVTELDQ